MPLPFSLAGNRESHLGATRRSHKKALNKEKWEGQEEAPHSNTIEDVFQNPPFKGKRPRTAEASSLLLMLVFLHLLAIFLLSFSRPDLLNWNTSLGLISTFTKVILQKLIDTLLSLFPVWLHQHCQFLSWQTDDQRNFLQNVLGYNLD